MAKKCPVTLNNGVVTCFMYGDVEVQAPAIADKNAVEVNVEYKDGIYTIVDEKKEEAVKEDVKTDPKTEDAKANTKAYFKANK